MKNSPPRTGYRNYWKNEELEIPYTESIDLDSEWRIPSQVQCHSERNTVKWRISPMIRDSSHMLGMIALQRTYGIPRRPVNFTRNELLSFWWPQREEESIEILTVVQCHFEGYNPEESLSRRRWIWDSERMWGISDYDSKKILQGKAFQ